MTTAERIQRTLDAAGLTAEIRTYEDGRRSQAVVVGFNSPGGNVDALFAAARSNHVRAVPGIPGDVILCARSKR